MAKEIKISDEEDAEAQRVEAARRAAREKERRKVKSSKTPLPKDQRAENTTAAPKVLPVSHASMPSDQTQVTRPKTKEPQGSLSKDTEVGKPVEGCFDANGQTPK